MELVLANLLEMKDVPLMDIIKLLNDKDKIIEDCLEVLAAFVAETKDLKRRAGVAKKLLSLFISTAAMCRYASFFGDHAAPPSLKALEHRVKGVVVLTSLREHAIQK